MASWGRALTLTLLFHRLLASPVPEIFPPDAGALSFAELTQKAFSQILELGFFRGVVVSLLILGLACLLVGSLRALAVYLNHHDNKLWESYEEVDAFGDEGKEAQLSIGRRVSLVEHRPPCTLRHQRRSRGSRRVHVSPSTPITKINIHASPRRATLILSPPSPSKSRLQTSTPWPSTPLRSALSKSPPSSEFLTTSQSFFLGPRRDTSTPSPKSVRWADEITVSVSSTVKMSVQRERGDDPQAYTAEMDITTRIIGSRDRPSTAGSDTFSSLDHHAEPPAYESLGARPIVAAGHLEPAQTSDL